MINFEVVTWDGQKNGSVIRTWSEIANNPFSDIIMGTMIREIMYEEYGWAHDNIKEFHIRDVDCEQLDLSALGWLDRIVFKQNVSRLKRLFTPTIKGLVVENVPMSVSDIKTSEYTTITNFDELIKNNTDIRMGERSEQERMLEMADLRLKMSSS